MLTVVLRDDHEFKAAILARFARDPVRIHDLDAAGFARSGHKARKASGALFVELPLLEAPNDSRKFLEGRLCLL